MKRILWICGLLIALLIFAGITLLCVYALFTHRHLTLAGWAMFLLNACGIWITFIYLRIKFKRGKSVKGNHPVATH